MPLSLDRGLRKLCCVGVKARPVFMAFHLLRMRFEEACHAVCALGEHAIQYVVETQPPEWLEVPCLQIAACTMLQLHEDDQWQYHGTACRKKGTRLSSHMAYKDVVAVKQLPEHRNAIDWWSTDGCTQTLNGQSAQRLVVYICTKINNSQAVDAE